MSWQDKQGRHWQIVFVVAMDNQNGIGRDNALPWHLPADLRHFKAKTLGGVILMGRKTFESMGRPLPGRANWVLTRQPDWQPADELQRDEVGIAHDLDSLLEQAADDASARGQQSLLIIGGAELFRATLPYCDRIELTRVLTDASCDTFFPALPADFRACDEQPLQTDVASGLSFQFMTLIRPG